jgi:ATP-dependent Clp protease ATP-binding subunit ClpC
MSSHVALWSCPTCGQQAPVLAPCARCAPDGTAPDGAALGAEGALDRGRASLCIRLLERQPADPASLALLARAFAREERWSEQAAALAALRALQPDDPALALAEARALGQAGQPREALAVLKLAPPGEEALELEAALALADPAADLPALARDVERRATATDEPSAPLLLLAGRLWSAAAARAPGPDEARTLHQEAARCLERRWQVGGPSLEVAIPLAEALMASDRNAIARLESVQAEGEQSLAWHRAYLGALLASPAEEDARRVQRAADEARKLFPGDPQLAAMAHNASYEAWMRRRREALASRPAPGDHADEVMTEDAPDFLSDLRARIRRGALLPTREVPDRQREIIEVLCRYERANAIVTGPSGCGKSALLRAVAHQISSRQDVPAMLHGYGLFELDPIGIVGGTDNVGVLEGRLSTLTRFCENNKLILFIDNFHLVLGAGSYTGRPAGLSELLQPLMSAANVKIVAATSDESYDSLTRSVGLERRMTRIRVPSMSVDQSVELLGWLKPRLEQHYKHVLPDPMLHLTARLAEHHIKSRALPDSAIDLLERACAKALVGGEHEVTSDHLLGSLAQLLRVPLEQVQLDRMSRLLQLEELLGKRVVGQPEAIRAVSDVIRMSKAEFDLHPVRPDGVFLFVGPSGVGKTELARGLAELLNTDETGFVRLDMSEFTEPHNVSRLFGTTAGYVGFENEGQLTGALRLNPGVVILLDEIEKAHPKVYDVFLQVFDAGRLTDGRGKTVDCSHATFIMTSNLGTAELGEARLGFLRHEATSLDRERIVKAALERHFRPEFLNRLDAVVVFRALDDATLHAIVTQKLAMLRGRFTSKNLEVVFDEALVPLIAGQTDRLRTGARGVLRAIEQLVVVPLTREVLTHQPHRVFHVRVEGTSVKITLG